MDIEKSGVDFIKKERFSQITEHGYDADMDDSNKDEELLHAAMYAITGESERWPWSDKKHQLTIFKKPRIEQLAVAGALIAAEIDRLNRKQFVNDINKKAR